eukprot:Rmarinus@m.4791
MSTFGPPTASHPWTPAYTCTRIRRSFITKKILYDHASKQAKYQGRSFSFYPEDPDVMDAYLPWPRAWYDSVDITRPRLALEVYEEEQQRKMQEASATDAGDE